MASHEQVAMQDAVRRIHRIQIITIAWMSIEAAISLTAAWKARSPALLAFGGDSAIELLSATAVLWRFQVTVEAEKAETHTARIAGVLLLALAAYVVAASILSLRGYAETKPTHLGIAILIAAVLFMPWLATQKRRLSSTTNSAALRADAAQSALCAYLSAVVLIGVGINGVWHIRWADPIAALLVTPLIIWEGKEAMRGKSCECY
jgi:divalent metal cation (Fe/Co/Zn/Cd) transporter